MPEEAEVSQARLRDQPVSEETLTLLDRNPLIQIDNLRLNDVQLAAEEPSLFKKLGGGSVIDVTPRGLGRDVNSVRKISDLTEFNIVVATGWYPVHCITGTNCFTLIQPVVNGNNVHLALEAHQPGAVRIIVWVLYRD